MKGKVSKYYALQFAKYLTTSFLPIGPIGGGLMLYLADPTISRVWNAYVKAQNKYLKETIFIVVHIDSMYNEQLNVEDEM